MRLKSNQPSKSMPPGGPTRNFLWCLPCLFLLVFAPLSLRAQTNQASAPTPLSANRFLFVVDTSLAMKGHGPEILNVLKELLISGLGGQMKRGDSVGLWTFNQDVYSELPTQPLSTGDTGPLALRITDFLTHQRFEKASHFERVLPNLVALVRASDILTIVIISIGDMKMHGAPFDDELNGLYDQTIKDMKGKRLPIVTLLQARGGKLVRYIMNALPWPVEIPEALTSLKSTNSPVVNTASNSAPQIAVTNAVPPKITNQPLILQGSVTPPKPPVETPAPVTAPSPTAAVIPTNAPLVATNQPPVVATVIPTNVPVVSSTNPVVVAANAVPTNAVAPAVTNPPPASVPPAPVAPPVASSTNILKDRALAFVEPEPVGRSKGVLITGVVLVVIAVILAIVMVFRRREASGPSLITRSMRTPKK